MAPLAVSLSSRPRCGNEHDLELVAPADCLTRPCLGAVAQVASGQTLLRDLKILIGADFLDAARHKHAASGRAVEAQLA